MKMTTTRQIMGSLSGPTTGLTEEIGMVEREVKEH
jgi:hypothetical protein